MRRCLQYSTVLVLTWCVIRVFFGWEQLPVMPNTQEIVKPRALDACPTLLPSFTFPLAVDDPRFHDGRNQSQPCKMAVVKTVTGGYDGFNFTWPTASSSGLCFFAFLDEESARSSMPAASLNNACFLSQNCSLPKIGQWHVVVINSNMTSSLPTTFRRTRASRLMKMLPHRAFSSADFVMFLDGKFYVRDVTALAVETFILGNIAPHGMRVPWAAPRHPERVAVYEEGLEVCMLRLASNEVVDQMKHYREKGYPILPPPFLVDGTWHIQDLNAPESSQIGCAWMQEYLSWETYRDQLSFNFALWTANLTAHWFVTSDSIPIVGVRPHSRGRELIPQATRCKELLELTPKCGWKPVGHKQACCTKCEKHFGNLSSDKEKSVD